MTDTFNQNTIRDRIAAHYNENDTFLKEFSQLVDFYFLRFSHYIRAKDDREDFQNSFIEYMKHVIETGYYMGDQFLTHDETSIPDAFLENPDGILHEFIIQPLEEATNGFDQSVTTDITASYEATLIDEYEGVSDEIFAARVELAYFGVMLAFQDERKQRQINVRDEPGDDLIGYLHRIDDLFHIDAKKYFHCISKNDTSEIWQLTPSNKVEEQHMNLGTLFIHHVPKERFSRLNSILPSLIDQEVPGTDIKETITVNLQLRESIMEKERITISQSVQDTISKRMNIGVERVIVNYSIVEEFYTLV